MALRPMPQYLQILGKGNWLLLRDASVVARMLTNYECAQWFDDWAAEMGHLSNSGAILYSLRSSRSVRKEAPPGEGAFALSPFFWLGMTLG